MPDAQTLILPHQLYHQHPALSISRPVIIYEHPLFFHQFKFHKQKLVLHRASMKFFAQELINQNFQVTYLEYNKKLPAEIELHLCYPSDNWIEKELQQNNSINYYRSPNFFNSKLEIEEKIKNSPQLRQHFFYISQRKKWQILVDENQEPIGGKWSFDSDNRRKLPKEITIPAHPKLDRKESSQFIAEAQDYIETNFPNNPGDTDNFIYPISRSEALEFLTDFIHNRFKFFGDFEDAISNQENFIFHSLLSAPLNIGLLNPQEIIAKANEAAAQNQIPLNSLEGFIRQILGWREFIHGIYLCHGSKQRSQNFFQHQRKIPQSFWNGKTGIYPIDHCIQNLKKTAYNHHIERLMILSNFMLLCEFEPNQIYEWFMSFYIDAYDWVMVPNIYGMSQFADGGMMTTKPYISSSNYILKMSNYPKGDWCEIWDALYWRFIHKHQNFFSKNPRLKMIASSINKMPTEKLNKHLLLSNKFLKTLNEYA